MLTVRPTHASPTGGSTLFRRWLFFRLFAVRVKTSDANTVLLGSSLPQTERPLSYSTRCRSRVGAYAATFP